MTRTARLAALVLGLVFVAVSAQGASRLTFSKPVELCANCGNHHIAVDASGKVYAIWSTNGALELWTSLDGQTFTRVSGPHSAIAGIHGDIAVAPAGDFVHLVWIDLDRVGPYLCDGRGDNAGFDPAPCYDVFYARSADGGRTFSTPVNISMADYGLYGPRIAVDATGHVLNVVWNQATTGEGNICCAREVYFTRSTDGGTTFSPPQRLSALQDSHNVDIATDTWGQVIDVAWWVSAAGGRVRQVYLLRSTDGGLTFSAPKLLADGSYPSVTSDGTGRIVNLAYAHDGIRFIRSTDDGVTFSSPAALSSVGYQPSTATDATGNLIDLVWSEGGGAKQWVRFARSSNGGKTFSTPQTIANVSQRYVLRPDLAVDGNGNINAIWGEWSSDTYTADLYYSRGTP